MMLDHQGGKLFFIFIIIIIIIIIIVFVQNKTSEPYHLIRIFHR